MKVTRTRRRIRAHAECNEEEVPGTLVVVR